MKRVTLLFPIFSAILLTFVLSGCGTASSTSSSSGSQVATSTQTASAVVKTTSTTVDGKSVTILTTAQGLTLYYFTPDTSTTVACTGTCAGTWPPLLFSGSGSPAASGNLPGVLTVYSTANGNQVLYNDHPLYTFKGDSAPGQTNGQGIKGKWFVATTDLAKNTASAAASTPASSGTAAAVVKTASATVDGKAVTILTTAQGLTLYYFTPDTATTVACTGGCAGSWPPLLYTGSGSPAASVKLPGSLEVYSNTNGKQITYNDHPLYTFSGDSAAGQTNGQGLGGKWFVATIDLAKNKA